MTDEEINRRLGRLDDEADRLWDTKASKADLAELKGAFADFRGEVVQHFRDQRERDDRLRFALIGLLLTIAASSLGLAATVVLTSR